MATRVLALCLLAAAWPVGGQDQGAHAILGRWDLTIGGSGAAYPSWLEVARAADGRLTGRFVGRFGSVRPMPKIEFKDGDLHFSLPPQYEKRKDDLTFKGRLSGDRLEGTTVGEDGKTLGWTGARAPDLRPAAGINWGQPVRLFNGRDLTGWRPREELKKGCWSVEGQTLTNHPPCVDLLTEQKFKDFKLSLEFKLVEKSNSGVYLRGRYEAQIEDNFGQEPESHKVGGVYGFLTPTANAAKKAGEWQTYEITLVGRQVTVALNGRTVVDRQEIPGITGGALDSDEGAPGPIMLQGDHGKVWFRNLVLTPAK